MKKIFIIAAAACVTLASCVKNEPVATVEQGEAITFNAPVVAPATKAQAEYTGGDFNVCAWYHTGTFAGTGEVYMDNVSVSQSGTNYSNSGYYWPKNNYLTFFAYSPASAVGNGLTKPTITSAGNVSLVYTVPDGTAASGQYDLLYSDWAKDQTKEENPVEIAFYHALSYVNFKMVAKTAADEKIKVKSITLGTVKNTNTFNCAFSPSTADWTGTASGTATYTVYENAGEVAALPLLTDESQTLSSFYLLPQTLEDEAVLNVTYYLLKPGADPSLASSWLQQTMPLQLNESAVTTWSKGTKYSYDLQFDLDLIEFAPTAEQWVETTPADTDLEAE